MQGVKRKMPNDASGEQRRWILCALGVALLLSRPLAVMPAEAAEDAGANERQKQAAEAFSKADADGDKKLTLEEFLVPVGSEAKAVSRARQRFLVCDFDGDKSLDFDEFRAVSAPVNERPNMPDPIADIKGEALKQWESIFAAADGDGSGGLTRGEWPAKPLADQLPGLAEVAFESWDADGNGEVDQAESRRLFDVAYGLKRPSGNPLRTPVGTVLSWYYTRVLDKNGDDALSQEEFVSGHHQGKDKNAEIFSQLDTNHDGRLDDAELASLAWTDSLSTFYHYDANQDGAVDDAEMVQGAAWGESVSRRTARAFDVDGDGKLSFKEFRATPVVNQVSNWWRPRPDADRDGRISWKEFYIEEPPVLIGLSRFVFDRFDLDDDGFLSFEEFEFPVDLAKAPPEVVFQVSDENHDQRLSLDEFLARRPETSHGVWRQRFRLFDFNGDEALDWDEFRKLSAPANQRGDVPDPIAELERQAFERWTRVFTEADGDGDGGLSRGEWPAKRLLEAAPALAEVAFESWDADKNGVVSHEESRRLFEVAYGLVKPNGKPLRTAEGRVMTWYYTRGLDADHDGTLSREEFVSRHSADKKKNADIFAAHDSNGDGRLDDDEMSTLYATDVLLSFLSYDSDRDGVVTADEILRLAPWSSHVCRHSVRAFDSDGDGGLSFLEFRAIPLTNQVSNWWLRRKDADNDGRLSWKEFYIEESPVLLGLSRFMFDRFDLDDDGFLSCKEFEFNVDLAKIPAGAVFQFTDLDGDGSLDFNEVFTGTMPLGEDAKAPTELETWRMNAKTAFDASDANGDARLSMDEFARWRPEGAKLAERRAQALARRKAAEEFAAQDGDGDKSLTLAEFLSRAADTARSDRRWQFFAWDTDEDEYLSLDEFTGRGAGSPVSAPNDFRRRDENDDRRLSLNEFLARSPEAARATLRRNFRVFDFNGDEALDWDEFRTSSAPPAQRENVPDPIVKLELEAWKGWEAMFAAADGDGSGGLSRREWPGKQFAKALPSLAEVPFASWDADGDGLVSQAESRQLFDVAYGVSRPDGKPLRTPSGTVFVWYYTRSIDKNGDGMLSRDEFVGDRPEQKAKNAELFAQRDANGDGHLDDAEMASFYWGDILGTFLGYDKDRDAAVSDSEFVNGAPWGQSVSRRSLRAFDADGNGTLSLMEFRATPVANQVSNWWQPRQDTDHDGRLSWKEFYIEKAPVLIALSRFMFDRFDLDDDGYLSFSEMEFAVDIDKSPPEVIFQSKDLDGDGKLVLAEIFTEKKPTDGDKVALDRYEMRLAAAESRFLSDDLDGSGYLDSAELAKSQARAMDAARRSSKVLSSRKTMLEGNYWVRKGVLVVNEIAFLAIVWTVVSRTRRRGGKEPGGQGEETNGARNPA